MPALKEKVDVGKLQQRMAHEAARMLGHVLRDRSRNTADFLALKPRFHASQYGLSQLADEEEDTVDGWRRELTAEVTALVYQIPDTARALAPLTLPGNPMGDGIIPDAEYAWINRVLSDTRGIAVTLAVKKGDTAITLWAGWV